MSERNWCVCEHCSVAIKDWLPDENPLEKHARENPQCPFVARINTLFFTNFEGYKAAVNSMATKLSSSAKYGLDALQELNLNSEPKEIPMEYVCKVCYNKEIEIAFLPCSHAVVCTQCAFQLQSCAVCKAKVQSVLRIKLPR
ncbi:Hypothetical predicted protein [Cloeon dipterum]|uniref:RING-type domain-containing protein n=1 Tax=Cloeon dipterum TaxID=197152 RepID=A0A8S1E2K6_9INSE|nr:Hypothetical predicted protein [Cloeon dipterum]